MSLLRGMILGLGKRREPQNHSRVQVSDMIGYHCTVQVCNIMHQQSTEILCFASKKLQPLPGEGVLQLHLARQLDIGRRSTHKNNKLARFCNP